MDKIYFISLFLSSVSRLELTFYLFYLLTHPLPLLSKWLINLIISFNQPPPLSNVVTDSCGICENNKSTVALLSPMCCIGGILNQAHLSILTPAPPTGLGLKTFPASCSCLPQDVSGRLEDLQLYSSITGCFFHLKTSCYLQCF